MQFSFVMKVMYFKLLFQKTDKSLDMYTKSCAEERLERYKRKRPTSRI